MNTEFGPKVDIQPKDSGENSDCLVDLVDRAENAEGGINENQGITDALNLHVVIDVQGNEAELMCQRCPVMCTVKSVGGSALMLVHNREECADQQS
jgi:hypothetical protein